MIDRLQEFLRSALGNAAPEEASSDEHGVRVAMAALLVEMARADFIEDEEERCALLGLLRAHFSLEKHEAEELLGLADRQADRAVSLQEFTAEIHAALTLPQKLKFLEMLIRVALADGRLDKHERHLLGKIADLIYIPHADYVGLRDRILGSHR
ncbi:MAG: TerB family tellurite resistance protein [Chromatiales bacterium]|nr:TerB family tellurite resistance protein [Chromatiales bacterium]